MSVCQCIDYHYPECLCEMKYYQYLIDFTDYEFVVLADSFDQADEIAEELKQLKNIHQPFKIYRISNFGIETGVVITSNTETIKVGSLNV